VKLAALMIAVRPLSAPTGVYLVEVLSDPVRVFPDVDLDPGETAELTVRAQEQP